MSPPARENFDRRGGISVKLTGLDSLAFTIENSDRGGTRWVFQAQGRNLPVKFEASGHIRCDRCAAVIAGSGSKQEQIAVTGQRWFTIALPGRYSAKDQ